MPPKRSLKPNSTSPSNADKINKRNNVRVIWHEKILSLFLYLRTFSISEWRLIIDGQRKPEMEQMLQDVLLAVFQSNEDQATFKRAIKLDRARASTFTCIQRICLT